MRWTTNERRRFLHQVAVLAGSLGSLRGLGADDAAENQTAGDLRPFADLLAAFSRDHDDVAMTLAVANGPRLVYAGAAGFADREQGLAAVPTSLFRIASLSKPITAVTLLRLVERGELALDERVVDRLALNGYSDPRWEQVTVLHLLQHTGGWDRGVSFDPMFRAVEIAEHLATAPPAGPWDVIHYMLEQPLDFDPGSGYAYSNFGYCLLGRVIEAVTGLDYAAAVQRELFGPLGIRDIRLGETLVTARGEVRYYANDEGTGPAVRGEIGREVPQPYGAWNLEAMDAHGGWIASAVELVRFSSALVDCDRCQLLSADLWNRMLATPSGAPGLEDNGAIKEVYYGCGWNVRRLGDGAKRNFWHQGSLPGTSTLLVCRHDGLSWAVLFNRRNDAEGKRLSSRIDPLMHVAANAVAEWPDHDLFPRYLQPAAAAGKIE